MGEASNPGPPRARSGLPLRGRAASGPPRTRPRRAASREMAELMPEPIAVTRGSDGAALSVRPTFVGARGKWRWQTGQPPRLLGSERETAAAALMHWLGRHGAELTVESTARVRSEAARLGFVDAPAPSSAIAHVHADDASDGAMTGAADAIQEAQAAGDPSAGAVPPPLPPPCPADLSWLLTPRWAI